MTLMDIKMRSYSCPLLLLQFWPTETRTLVAHRYYMAAQNAQNGYGGNQQQMMYAMQQAQAAMAAAGGNGMQVLRET